VFDFLCSRLGGATSKLKIQKLHNFGGFPAMSGDTISQ